MSSLAPLMGYNTNVRHKGKLYHIQTEDSGIKHPHIITHLFADGGRILATRKTSYAEHTENPSYRDVVKELMQKQHKSVFIELRDGVHDEDDLVTKTVESDAVNRPAAIRPAQKRNDTSPAALPVHQDDTNVDLAATIEEAASEMDKKRGERLGLFLDTRFVIDPQTAQARSGKPFGSELLSEHAFDEVIIRYLTNQS